MKIKLLLTTAFLVLIPGKTMAQQKPIITGEAGTQILSFGMVTYSKAYCMNRERGFIDEDASSIAFEDALLIMHQEANKYYLGGKAIFHDEIFDGMARVFPIIAERRCPEYFN